MVSGFDSFARPVRVVMSTHDNADPPSESVADAVTAMKLEKPEDPTDAPTLNGGGTATMESESQAASPELAIKDERTTPSPTQSRNSPQAPPKKEQSESNEGVLKQEADDDASSTERVGGGIVVKLEPGEPPKLTRSSSQKVVPRPPQLFSDLPDYTKEAQKTFEIIENCQYANKYMGYTEHAMECDCAEEWGETIFFFHYLACGSICCGCTNNTHRSTRLFHGHNEFDMFLSDFG